MGKDGRKVVPLPGLFDRYVDKGIEEIKNRRYVEAEKSFARALELGKSTRAQFGMMTCLYQTGQFAEAKAYCEELLEEEMESREAFYEYLQVYIMILKELKEFQRAADVLKTSLKKQYVPPGECTEKCRQWLAFFQEKIGEPVDPESHSDELEGWRRQDDEMRHYYMKELERIREALQDREGDPYIKSLILQDLKLNQLEMTVSVYKFGEEIPVNTKNMLDITEEPLYVDVREILAEKLESDNPTLYQMAVQLWEHFTMTMFPVPIEPTDRNVWAAAVYQTVHMMNGMELDAGETVMDFHITEAELQDAIEKVETAEKATSV